MNNKKPSIFKNAALIGGGALGAAALTFGAAGVAGAQDSPTLDDPAPAEETEETSDRGARRQAVIDQLIEDGVITQEQADNVSDVRAALQEEREARKAEKLAAIADAIGIGVDELKEAKDAGTPLADIAGDNLPAVVDLFVENATERIEGAVESDRITQEEADEKLDGLEERIETRLEEGGGFGRKGEGKRGEGRRGEGPRGNRGGADAAAVETLDA